VDNIAVVFGDVNRFRPPFSGATIHTTTGVMRCRWRTARARVVGTLAHGKLIDQEIFKEDVES